MKKDTVISSSLSSPWWFYFWGCFISKVLSITGTPVGMSTPTHFVLIEALGWSVPLAIISIIVVKIFVKLKNLVFKYKIVRRNDD